MLFVDIEIVDKHKWEMVVMLVQNQGG